MILTYKVKHNQDFSEELAKARQVAEYAALNKGSKLSSKHVKHIGLKSAISNQILRKYGRNQKIKQVKRVNLTIPNQSIKVDKETRTIRIPCLRFSFQYHFPDAFEKVNQIEINKDYVFVSVSVPEQPEIEPDNWIGVDLNTTGHVAVVANPKTGKVSKLGKSAEHVHKKYKSIRKSLQKAGKYRKIKSIKNRESRIVRDLNHKISKHIVSMAKASSSGIKVEELQGIRQRTKQPKSFRYSLNSWSFYQLQTMIAYKAKLQGIPVVCIDPHYTSKDCSRCGLIGNRQGKVFRCSHCGHVDHADCNAAFVIALRSEGTGQSDVDRDASEGSTGTPEEATVRTQPTLKPPQL